jgi:dihydrolipoamide dehydrogenase
MGNYDTIVVGSGPGGYVAAIKASQLGQKTALVEKEQLGGVCLNWGCIPTKAIIYNAEIANLLKEGKSFGFSFDNLQIDYSAAQERSRQVAERQVKGVNFLMNKNKIEVIKGLGVLKSPTEIEVEGQTHQAKNFIVATGAQAKVIPGL